MSCPYGRNKPSAFSAPVGVSSLLVLLGACTTTSNITLRPDGSAFVQVRNVTVDRRAYYHRDVILDADTAVPTQVNFVISDLDSLGHYLPWLRFESIEFKRNRDMITIHSVPGEPRHACGPGWTRAHSYLLVEQGIKTIRSDGELVNPQEGKWAAIIRPNRKAKKNKPLDIAIEVAPSRE